MKYILVVESDQSTRESLTCHLRRYGYEAAGVADANAALLCFSDRLPDLVLLEWLLSDINGLDLTRKARDSQPRWIPFMMITDRSSKEDHARALDAGVDDIVAKPFSHREVLARINALLRRQKSSQSAVRSAFGELTFDPHEQCIMAGCHRIPLRPTDFRLLRFLARNSESAHSRSVLIKNVWGGPNHANQRTVDVQVTRLRQLLEPYKLDHLIQTVTGVGYRYSNYTQDVGNRFAARKRRRPRQQTGESLPKLPPRQSAC